MRISDQLLISNYLTGVNKSKSEIQRIQNQILTQSKINKPSDSPSGTEKSLRLVEQLNANTTYSENIDNGLSFMQTTVSTMGSIQDEVQKIQVALSEINNASVTSENLKNYADKIDLAINSILDLANTEYDNKFIFGGTDFSQAPYGYNAAGTAVEMKVGSTAGELKIRISKQTVQKINVSGQELFGNLDGTDIFNTLISIKNNLNAGIKPTTAQANTLESFNTSLTNRLTAEGEAINRLSSTKELLGNQNLELQDLLVKETGIDTGKAVTDLQNQQYYLDLSYKMSSMILPKSLLDFL